MFSELNAIIEERKNRTPEQDLEVAQTKRRIPENFNDWENDDFTFDDYEFYCMDD